MRKLIKWADEHFEETMIILLLIALSCVMMLQVILRYVFNKAPSWSDEFCRYSYIWITYFSVGLTIKERSYFRVITFVQAMGERAEKIFEVIAQVVNLFFFGVSFYCSIDVFFSAVQSGQQAPAMMIPMWIVYLVIPIGMGVATIRSIQMIWVTLQEAKSADHKKTDGDEISEVQKWA